MNQPPDEIELLAGIQSSIDHFADSVSGHLDKFEQAIKELDHAVKTLRSAMEAPSSCRKCGEPLKYGEISLCGNCI